MTTVMWRLHQQLPSELRYALPPRELTDEAAIHITGRGFARSTVAVTAHFGYGAAAGALLGAVSKQRSLGIGAGFGLAVWAASYLGWIPSAGLLRPAIDHPRARNALMLAAHLVWGCSLVLALRELEQAEISFAGHERPDAEPGR